MFNNFFWKSCVLWNNVDKYATDRQATHYNIKRRMRIAFWINKANDTHSEYVILIAFLRQYGCKNAPHYYVVLHCLSSYVLFKRTKGFQSVFLNTPSCGLITQPTFSHIRHQISSKPKAVWTTNCFRTPSVLVGGCQIFGEVYCLHCHGCTSIYRN